MCMMSESSTPQAPRIAIKFGAPAANSSKSANTAKKTHPPSSLGKRPRSHALNNDSDSEQDDEQYGKHESVTTFGENGPENHQRPRDGKAARTGSKPLVIACQTDGGWKAAAKAAQRGGNTSFREQENILQGEDKETEPADQDKPIKWGLSISKKPTEQVSPNDQEDSVNSVTKHDEVVQEGNLEGTPRTVDQDAMDALLGNDKQGKKQKLIIEGFENTQDEFKAALQAAGEVSTIEEYDQIPDGEFGMAMLRGMGYDETKQSSRPKEVRRRPALLGLGAKEDEEIKKADLAKRNSHRNGRPRLDEYRRGEETKRQQREERYANSYKHEREREKSGYGSSRKSDDRYHRRDRQREGDRNDRDIYRHRDRHSRY